VRETLDAYGLPEPSRQLVHARTEEIDALLVGAPKGMKWKARARVGERVKWYEEPEEAR
jgi:hypothetical protein